MTTINKPYEIRIVLVRSLYERNIGSTARAMSNMGGASLILIEPQCEITIEGHQAAASGQGPLENRTTYKTWNDFLIHEPESIKIAFTARDGKGRLVRDFASELKEIAETSPYFHSNEDFDDDLSGSNPTKKDPVIIHLVFGPEDCGLAAEDIAHVNYCCSIPTYGNNTSLNLAQATLLALFIIRSEWGGERTRLEGQQPTRKAPSNPSVFPDETLKSWITEMGFDLSKRKMNAYVVLKRMLLQNTPTKKELGILEIVLQQSIRKLNEYNQMRKFLDKKGLDYKKED